MARLPKVGGDEGNWGQILNDYLSESLSANGSLNIGTVGSVQLKPNAVTRSALADGTVTSSKIADGAVGSNQLADGAVSLAKVSGAGSANGFATLGGSGTLPEAQLPARLSSSSLSNSFTPSDAVPVVVIPSRFSVDPSGVTDSAPGIQAAIDAAYATVIATQKAANNDSVNIAIKRDVEIPAGLYKINSSLILKQGVNLRLSDAAVIRAGATMTALLDSSPTVLLQRSSVSGGVWDCNALAQTAIYLRWGIAMILKEFRVNDPTQHAIIIGDSAATSSSYEVTIAEVDLYRPRSTVGAAGYAGLWMQNVTDSLVSDIVPRGFDIGVRNDGGNNSFFRCHPWNPTGQNGPSICFDENGSNSRYIDCYADSPYGYGWRLRKSSIVHLERCTWYLSPSSTGDYSTAIYCDGTPTLHASGSIYGTWVNSDTDPLTKRWLNDIVYAAGANLATRTRWDIVVDQATVINRAYSTRSNRPSLSIFAGNFAGALQFNRASADIIRSYKDVTGQPLVYAVNADGGVLHGNGTGLGGAFYSGTGAPVGTLGVSGDLYHRTDTPAVANQRIYVKTASTTWTGIL